METQSFCHVTFCRQVNYYRIFDGSWCFHLQGQAVIENRLPGPEGEGITNLRNVGNYKSTQPNISEDVHLQQHHCEQLKPRKTRNA